MRVLAAFDTRMRAIMFLQDCRIPEALPRLLIVFCSSGLIYSWRRQEWLFVLRTLKLVHRKSIRAQALLVAVLYLFLSTFGMLTHSHAGQEGDSSIASAVSFTAVAVTPAHPILRAGHVSAPRECAFCDWQANSVSAALPPFRVLYMAPTPEAPVGRTGRIHTAFLARFSSRAPPMFL